MILSVRARHHLIDSFYIGVLMLFVLAGIWLTPFHGDESTIIYMSRDWYTLVVRHDFGAVFYQERPPTLQAQQDQDLRLLNGTLSKYAIGFGWWLAGMQVSDVNSPWDWDVGWWQNLYYGHLPGPVILFISRMTSALMTALSVGVVFAITRRLAGRTPAWIGAFVYATMPAVLLNGRRAMFEGANLLTLALVLLSGVVIASHLRSRISAKHWLLLGATAGLALASKHTALLTVVPVFGLLLMGCPRLGIWKTVRGLLAAGILAGMVFLALNPAWWSAPLAMPRNVLDLRQRLMSIQGSGDRDFMYSASRWTGAIPFVFGKPQYFEDTSNDWPIGIGGQIAAYEASGLAGIDWYQLGALVYVVLTAGLAWLVRRHRPAHVLFAGAAIFSLAALLATNTLPWQRYYLPVAACLAILFGMGITALFGGLGRLWQLARTPRMPPERPVSPVA